jgi:uncharacterized protein with PQ loop repeat
MWKKVNNVGTSAAILGPIALLFQLIKIIIMKNADELSWSWLGLGFIVSILWLIYSIQLQLLPIFISSVLFLVINLGLIIFKIIYDKKNKIIVNKITDIF